MCVKIMSVILKYGRDNYITEGEIAEKVGVKKWCISKYISMLKSWKLVEVKLGRGGGVRFNKTGLPKDYIFFYKRCANSPIVQKEDKDIYKIINTSAPQKKILVDINNKKSSFKKKQALDHPSYGCSNGFGAVIIPKGMLKQFYDTVSYAHDCFLAKNYDTGDYVAVSFKLINTLVKKLKVPRDKVMVGIYCFADWICKVCSGIGRIFKVGRAVFAFLKKDFEYHENIYREVEELKQRERNPGGKTDWELENERKEFINDMKYLYHFQKKQCEELEQKYKELEVEYKKYKNEPIKLEQFIDKEEAMSIVSEIKNKNDYLYKRLDNDFVDNLKKVELRVKFYDILNERLKIEIEQLKQTERV